MVGKQVTLTITQQQAVKQRLVSARDTNQGAYHVTKAETHHITRHVIDPAVR